MHTLTAVGAEMSTPPRFSHEPDHEPPLKYLWYKAPSVPIPKTSYLPGPQLTMLGSEIKIPPSDFHPLHERPSQRLCQSALSVPRPTTSN